MAAIKSQKLNFERGQTSGFQEVGRVKFFSYVAPLIELTRMSMFLVMLLTVVATFHIWTCMTQTLSQTSIVVQTAFFPRRFIYHTQSCCGEEFLEVYTKSLKFSQQVFFQILEHRVSYKVTQSSNKGMDSEILVLSDSKSGSREKNQKSWFRRL